MERERSKLVGAVRRAVEDYGMIAPGDRVAVGVSGGKDSLVLLYALARLRVFYRAPFELVAVMLDLGFPDVDPSRVEEYSLSLGVPFYLERTQIGPIVFDTRKEPSPCSLCSRLRRGILVQKAKDLGCNRLALGHTREDAVETLLMSMFYEGRIHCFEPVSWLSRSELHLIRPLAHVREDFIRSLVDDLGLPVLKSPCPATGTTSRGRVEDLLSDLSVGDPELGDRIFGSLLASGIDGWKKPASHRGEAGSP